MFRMIFVDFVDNYYVAYRYDSAGPNAGQITIEPRTGYFVTLPFVTSIHSIDLRPMQVCITAINRTLNCKLVQFEVNDSADAMDKTSGKGLRLFLQWHGRDDYANNQASGENGTVAYSQFHQIMMNYAFDPSGRTYPFLRILPSSTDMSSKTESQAK